MARALLCLTEKHSGEYVACNGAGPHDAKGHYVQVCGGLVAYHPDPALIGGLGRIGT